MLYASSRHARRMDSSIKSTLAPETAQKVDLVKALCHEYERPTGQDVYLELLQMLLGPVS